jgi:orotate phosphoribosyltransferase
VLRGDFLLRSGARSSYYIDKYLFTTQPDLLQRLATELAARLPRLQGLARLHGRPGGQGEAQRLAGVALGAVPLVTAVSLVTQVPMVIVRSDKPKGYGTAKQIEGKLVAGERVVLIEDVVTTAGAALAAVEVLREAGADVLGALGIVDREEGGAAAFAAEGVAYETLFTKTSLGL